MFLNLFIVRYFSQRYFSRKYLDVDSCVPGYITYYNIRPLCGGHETVNRSTGYPFQGYVRDSDVTNRSVYNDRRRRKPSTLFISSRECTIFTFTRRRIIFLHRRTTTYHHDRTTTWKISFIEYSTSARNTRRHRNKKRVTII